VSFTPMTSGMRSVRGMPNITVCASSPPTPQREHADAVHHRRVAVGADHQVGHDPALAVAHLGRRHGGELLQVDGVHDPGAGRMDAHAASGFEAQRRKR
jgi:hypothetical protein